MSDKLFLNLGSGQRRFQKPFLNVDVQSEPGREPDLQCDISSLPFDDGSAEMIVLHQVIEHFGCGEADGVIAECFRLLAPGGRLILTVPNMRTAAQRWLMGNMETQLYLTLCYGAFMGDDADRHKWGFDEQHLRQNLERFGWSQVQPFNWREIEGAHIAKDWWILGMECIK